MDDQLILLESEVQQLRTSASAAYRAFESAKFKYEAAKEALEFKEQALERARRADERRSHNAA